MGNSQNCVFEGQLRATDPNLPAGESLLGDMCQSLRNAGWECVDPELWGSSGWSLVASCDREEVEVAMTSVGDGKQFLQIAPHRTPAVLGRLMGKKPSATPESVFAVADVAHRHLTGAGFDTQLWRWDGYPDDESGTTSPAPA